MTILQIEQIHKREITWERAIIALFLLFQTSATTLIYLNDSQSGFFIFALVTTFVKSVVIAAILVELMRFADRLLKKHWLYAAPMMNKNISLASH
ncbi:MAG: hypothetical protein OEL79_03550 [Chromatiales bacterium]|nr:hypothetical protein [Chromatiales bacterium]